MKYINEAAIWDVIQRTRTASTARIKKILSKAAGLKRLSLLETATLLNVTDRNLIRTMYQTAAHIKRTIYGKRIVLFVPLYISSRCVNNCLYCAFRSENRDSRRQALSIAEARKQVSWLLTRGHKRILMVAGEPPVRDTHDAGEYYARMVKAIYAVRLGQHRIRRVNVNCAPLSIAGFKKLKAAGIGTYQLFQETYHDQTYRTLHASGPKSDPNKRIQAIDDAYRAGIDDVGVGVLYGLFDHVFDTVALLMHIEHLEKTFKVGPHTISIPRLEPAAGTDFFKQSPYKVSDDDFKKITAVLRISVPYTGIILSTRESQRMRDELFHLGVSQVSAESNTAPGGYTGKRSVGQFITQDLRKLDDVALQLSRDGFIPSFCTACYRSKRTGAHFMELARPGVIKEKCNINALITFYEYLCDFASPQLHKVGSKLLQREKKILDVKSQEILEKALHAIGQGKRDMYV